MAAATPIGARVARPRLTDVELYAWIAQAEAGARLEYHRGFLWIDVTPVISTQPEPERRQLADLGPAALIAALLHELGSERGSLFCGRSYPMATVTGMPSAV